MKKLFRKICLLVSVFAMIVATVAFSASAQINWGTSVKITSKNQVVNSITFKGVTVNAVYAPRNQISNYDSDSTYCCAAFVSKFYRSVYGIGVNNLYPGNTPNVYSGSGYFYKTTSPKVGDIAANSGHWAIVKAVSGNTITLIEQNAWKDSYTSAAVNRKLILPENSYWFWRYSLSEDAKPSWKTTASKVNLGSDFYARIVNTASGKVVTVSGDNVVINERKNSADQIWRFTKNSDGTYKITNKAKGKVLDVADAATAASTNVQLWNDNGTNAQQWGVYGSQGKYILSANCTDCIMDIQGGSTANGTNIIAFTKNSTSNQLFTIETIVAPAKPTVTVATDGEKVNISWAKDTNADSYELKVTQNGEACVLADTIANSSQVTLTDGTYSVVVTAKNVLYGTSSDTKSFTVCIDKCAQGHTYTSKVTKAATCSATGVKTYTCSVCKATKTETIAKTAHKYGEYKPACDFTNFPKDTQTRTCSVCKATQKTTYTMKYYDSNSGVTAGSSYVKVAFDETDLEDIGGVKFYLYDAAAKKYVRDEDEKIEKAFDEETWGYIYKIKGLKANTEYTILTVLYGCWDWSGEPGEKMEDDIVSIKKSTIKTLNSGALGTTSSITATKTSTSVTLKWNAVAGADGYRVYRKTSSGWLTLGHTTRLTYTDNSLKANTKYTYAVKAYVLEGTAKVFAPKYKTLDVTTAKATLGTTSKITATKTTSSVTLKWNKVTGATGYRVYQKTSSGWKALTNTTKLTYTVKSLKASTKYTFAIRAYVTKSGKMTLAPKYKTLDVTTTSSSAKPAQVKNVKATPTATTVKLTWSKVSGVKGYYVFSYNSKTKKYTSLGKTTGTSFTVKKLKANTAYQYAVQAYKVSGGKNVYGKVSSVVKVTTKLATPTVKLTSTVKGKANLTWNNIAGESGYAIYMATAKNGKYTHLSNYKANSTKATKSNLKSGRTYYFKIRAYKTVNGAKTYSAYSAVKGIKIK